MDLIPALTGLCVLCTLVSFWCLRQMMNMSQVLQELIATYGEATRTDQCIFNHTHQAGTRCQETATHKVFILQQGGAMVPRRVCQAHAQVLMSYPGQAGVAYAETIEEENEDECKKEA